MKHLDLCSGIGGFALAARWADIETVQFCEIDKWCQQVLKKHWPDVPCHDDLKTFNGNPLYGKIDILTAGYPCQPFSVAGQRKGEKDPRHLWPEVLRIITEVRPRWVICENVEGHVRLGLNTVLAQLEGEGYTVFEPFIIPASGIGAKHQRKRIWIMAYAYGVGHVFSESEKQSAETEFNALSDTGASGSDVAYAESGRGRRSFDSDSAQGIEGSEIAQFIGGCPISRNVSHADEQRTQISFKGQQSGKQMFRSTSQNGETIAEFWAIEPSVGRVADGVSRRVDRIKGLGNAIVPQIPYLIMENIKNYESFGKFL